MNVKYKIMDLKYKNCILFLVSVILITGLRAQHAPGEMLPEKPSVHGMLVFGNYKIYASHLPLFHPPHNYQIIIELEFDKAARQKFIRDQQLHPEHTTYTIEPERFVLTEMINAPKSFKAALYRGHFERGGTKIVANLTVHIVQVILFKKLPAEETKPTATDFILFGNSKEQFIVHAIINKPDFEQIIQVHTILPAFTDNKKYAKLTLDTSSNAPIGVSGNQVTAQGYEKNPIQLLKQIYLEFADLKE